MINLVTGERPEVPLSSADRLNIVQNFPGAAARTFEAAKYVFERYVLGWDADKKKPLRYGVAVDVSCFYPTGLVFISYFPNWLSVHFTFNQLDKCSFHLFWGLTNWLSYHFTPLVLFLL